METFSKHPFACCATFAIGMVVTYFSYRSWSQKPFKRLTKAEKRAKKYAERKRIQKLKKKQQRAKEGERKKRHLRELSPEEQQQLRIRRRKEKEDQVQRQKDAMAATSGVLQVAVDLGYTDCDRVAHAPREKRSLVKQLCYAYSYVRTSLKPPCIHLTSFSNELGDMLTKQGSDRWFVKCHTQSVFEVFDKEQMVYLTPDSPNVLEKLDLDKVYVIGGIVDRSVKKGRSFVRASQEEVHTARLPIQETFPRRSTHVLNIDAVVRALILFTETQSWEKALEVAVPKRIQKERSKKKQKKESNELRKDPYYCKNDDNDKDDDNDANISSLNEKSDYDTSDIPEDYIQEEISANSNISTFRNLLR